MNKIEIKIPNKKEFLSVLRLTTSKALSIYDAALEDIEDTILAVGELALIAHEIEDEYIKADIKADVSEIKIEIKLKNEYALEEDRKMSKMIIESLADEYEVKENKIIVTKKIG